MGESRYRSLGEKMKGKCGKSVVSILGYIFLEWMWQKRFWLWRLHRLVLDGDLQMARHWTDIGYILEYEWIFLYERN